MRWRFRRFSQHKPLRSLPRPPAPHGINLGDIIIEEDGDVYGDGVNVAARLEQRAVVWRKVGNDWKLATDIWNFNN